MNVDVAGRQDDAGAAYAGSQLQTQLYVNRRTQELDEAIRNAFADLAGAALEWRSPLAEDGYREYWDMSFLKRLDLDDLTGELPKFWPVGGPHWDALGVVHLPGDDRPGVLLVEGKSYPDELFGSGTAAKAGSDSRKLIKKSLGQTQQLLGVEGQTPEDWCGRLYQSASHLAHVYWLREQSVRAWLVHLLFTEDPHGPTTGDEWEKAMAAADDELGVAGLSIPAAAHIMLPAGTRNELLS
jgi:hypothetical protein